MASLITENTEETNLDRCKCYLCESLCYCDSEKYKKCEYRYQKSFGVPENRAYENACTRIAVRFARKHGWRFDGWVGHFNPAKHNWYEGAGGHALINDMVFSMEDMRTDIMMDADPEAITTFYDECVEEGFAAERENREPRYVNYRNWLLGARFNLEDCSSEYLEKRDRELKEAQERLEKSRSELMAILQRDADELLANSDGLY